MHGQWTGKYSGTDSGTLILDIDDKGYFYKGNAYLYPDDLSVPSSYVELKTDNKIFPLTQKVETHPIAPHSSAPVRWETLSEIYPTAAHGKSANITIHKEQDSLLVSWKTDIGVEGRATLPKSRAGLPSGLQPEKEIATWKDFKQFVNNLEYQRFIFRGQDSQKRLRTSFHRTGRADLLNYLNSDVAVLHRHLTQRTRNVFNLNDPDQNGAFLNLAQHHGYPTPLLDWTFSPFVSAFFAYRNLKPNMKNSELENRKVRIFLFDKKEWESSTDNMKSLIGFPHFSIINFIAIENERMLPQQSVTSVTNVDDIESHITKIEEVKQKKFLKVIDLPAEDRDSVMKDLSLMGITAASLFPGLDGTCEALKEHFFLLSKQ